MQRYTAKQIADYFTALQIITVYSRLIRMTAFIFFQRLTSRDNTRHTVLVGKYHVLSESGLTTQKSLKRLFQSSTNYLS